MSKMSIAEAAAHFNISKEAIHNRIRRGTLDCVIDQGVKYVVLGESPMRTQASDTKYYEYIEKENAVLKEKIATLENETKLMRTQREQSLIDERLKIEQIYKERDMQLRNVLQVVASKFLTQGNVDSVIEEAITAEVLEISEDESVSSTQEPKNKKTVISLKKFLKIKGYKPKKHDKVKTRFEKEAEKDSRIIMKDGKIYLDPSRYDYGDFLK